MLYAAQSTKTLNMWEYHSSEKADDSIFFHIHSMVGTAPKTASERKHAAEQHGLRKK